MIVKEFHSKKGHGNFNFLGYLKMYLKFFCLNIKNKLLNKYNLLKRNYLPHEGGFNEAISFN